MIDYTLQTEISMTDISSWYNYWNKLIQLVLWVVKWHIYKSVEISLK